MAQSRSQKSWDTNRMRVFLVGMDPLMRMGFTHVINEEPDFWVCGAADDTGEGIEAVASITPNLVLLELAFPGYRGLEFIKTLCLQAPLVKILVLSGYHETLYAVRSLCAGAHGYLPRSITPSVL